MLFKGILGTDLSGSVDGITASRNRGGAYFRARAVPVNPNTSFQQTIRSAMSTLVARWNDTLTQAQREDWETYAENVPVVNRIGETITLTGQNMYLRSNIVATQIGATLIDDAPTTFNLGEFSEPTLSSADATGNTLELAFVDTDDWVDEDGSYLIVWSSRGQNPSINFFKGPYQFAEANEGDSVTPPTSPLTITSPFGLSDGQSVFARARVLRADGRLSAEWRGNVAVTTP